MRTSTGTYFRQYLQTAEAKQIITDWVNDLYKDVDIEISEADLQAMAQELGWIFKLCTGKRICRCDKDG